MRGSLRTAFSILVAGALLPACSAAFDGTTYHRDGVTFRVPAPPASWERLEADGASTRVRARVATTPQTSGVYGGLVGGLGGGLGGGGAGAVTMLFGTHVLLLWVGGMLGLSVVLARFVSKRLAVAQSTRLERLVAALASDLADSRRAGTPRTPPSEGPTDKPAL